MKTIKDQNVHTDKRLPCGILLGIPLFSNAVNIVNKARESDTKAISFFHAGPANWMNAPEIIPDISELNLSLFKILLNVHRISL